eukprot:gene14183-biopygen14159
MAACPNTFPAPRSFGAWAAPPDTRFGAWAAPPDTTVSYAQTTLFGAETAFFCTQVTLFRAQAKYFPRCVAESLPSQRKSCWSPLSGKIGLRALQKRCLTGRPAAAKPPSGDPGDPRRSGGAVQAARLLGTARRRAHPATGGRWHGWHNSGCGGGGWGPGSSGDIGGGCANQLKLAVSEKEGKHRTWPPPI